MMFNISYRESITFYSKYFVLDYDEGNNDFDQNIRKHKIKKISSSTRIAIQIENGSLFTFRSFFFN